MTSKRPFRLLLVPALLTVALLATITDAQPSWQASAPTVQLPLEVFAAVRMANLPTATTLGGGDFFYEISHRFHPTLDEGYDANFGLDGPVSMRTALSYGLGDHCMVTLGRSNVLDNLDLQLRVRVFEADHHTGPVAVAINAGVALNSDIPAIVDRDALDADNVQYFAQLVANTVVLDGRLGLGVVPSYVYNSAIFAVEKQHTVTLATYGQYHFNPMWALFAEYSPALSGYQGILLPGEGGRSHDSLALGTSLSTGGHDFYLFVTNNTRLSAAQYLVGAPSDAGVDNWRLAFSINRHL